MEAISIQKNNLEIFKAFSLVSQLGLSVMVPIFMCIWFAQWLKRNFDLDFMLLLIFLGLGAGMRSAYILIQKSMPKNEEIADTIKHEQDMDIEKGGEKKRTIKPKRKSRIFTA